tara:strand:+ start:4076 stop:4333 length:258 start_codon:yes stop_codon:yes gene_type:complete
MGGTIKIRLPNDLWWTEVSYDNVLKWVDLEVSYLTDSICFVSYSGPISSSRIHIELYRDDYDKIMDNKIFKIKFGLKKHNFKYEK